MLICYQCVIINKFDIDGMICYLLKQVQVYMSNCVLYKYLCKYVKEVFVKCLCLVYVNFMLNEYL